MSDLFYRNHLLNTTMDALLSMPWLYETLAEGVEEEEVSAVPTVDDKVPDQEAMLTGRLL